MLESEYSRLLKSGLMRGDCNQNLGQLFNNIINEEYNNNNNMNKLQCTHPSQQNVTIF